MTIQLHLFKFSLLWASHPTANVFFRLTSVLSITLYYPYLLFCIMFVLFKLTNSLTIRYWRHRRTTSFKFPLTLIIRYTDYSYLLKIWPCNISLSGNLWVRALFLLFKRFRVEQSKWLVPLAAARLVIIKVLLRRRFECYRLTKHVLFTGSASFVYVFVHLAAKFNILFWNINLLLLRNITLSKLWKQRKLTQNRARTHTHTCRRDQYLCGPDNCIQSITAVYLSLSLTVSSFISSYCIFPSPLVYAQDYYHYLILY